MKSQIYVFLLILLLTGALNTQAQPTSAAEEAEKLRLQLIDVQTKEEALRTRAAQVDEALKPENIERSLAGVGSTRPEELREARRRQLQAERDGITAQLQVLETSRARLEAAILDADARAYQESARENPTNNGLVAQSAWAGRWLVSGGAGVAIIGLLTSIVVRRRLRRKRITPQP